MNIDAAIREINELPILHDDNVSGLNQTELDAILKRYFGLNTSGYNYYWRLPEDAKNAIESQCILELSPTSTEYRGKLRKDYNIRYLMRRSGTVKPPTAEQVEITGGSSKNKRFPVAGIKMLVHRSNVVCLEIVGAQEAVRANIASFYNNSSKNKHLNSAYIGNGGTSKSHPTESIRLKSGLQRTLMINCNAIPNSIESGAPFVYALSESHLNPANPPATFYPLLNASVPIPMQPNNATKLFHAGQARKLVRPICSVATGVNGWAINTNQKSWEAAIRDGLELGDFSI